MGDIEIRILLGELEGIGRRNGLFHAKDTDGKNLIEQQLDIENHRAALKVFF